MPLPRKFQIAPDIALHYHLISRCVRRAFLCGHDPVSKRSFEHRRQWIVDRLAELTQAFAIDVCAYAVMSNHLHCVVRLNPQTAADWSPEEVVEHWTRIYRLPAVIREAEDAGALPEIVDAAARKIEQLRDRLQSISWFMKSLNEYIARRANAEDQCTGAFWEGRFKSQALLDERAIVACMAYVDLNPIRASIAKTLEESDFTSVQQRLRQCEHPTVPLVPFADEHWAEVAKALPIERGSYLELIHWTARAVIFGKRGAIPTSLPPILDRLKMDERGWERSMKLFRRGELRFLGPANLLQDIADRLSRKWLKGLKACQLIFGST